jgi:hypothetical protein
MDDWHRGRRNRFFDLTKFRPPAAGSLGNAGKGTSLPGSWRMNFALYKDIVRSRGFSTEFSALLDNALNHSQFSVGLGTSGALVKLMAHFMGECPRMAQLPWSTPTPWAATRVLGGAGRAVRDTDALLQQGRGTSG